MGLAAQVLAAQAKNVQPLTLQRLAYGDTCRRGWFISFIDVYYESVDSAFAHCKCTLFPVGTKLQQCFSKPKKKTATTYRLSICYSGYFVAQLGLEPRFKV